jgi:hypothetical protein
MAKVLKCGDIVGQGAAGNISIVSNAMTEEAQGGYIGA